MNSSLYKKKRTDKKIFQTKSYDLEAYMSN